MKTPYSYVILRYIHDVMTGEFVNVGVAIYAPKSRFIGGLCNTRYGRISKMFGEIEGDYFKGLMRHIEARFEEVGEKLLKELPFNGNPSDILQIAREILPLDDSSLQWSEVGGGLTDDPSKTLEDLFGRIVVRYDDRQKVSRREDEDIWRVFKKELEIRHVLGRLQSKRIVAHDYDYEFEHAWKNQDWHMLEPISFDLLEADTIVDKANRWLGRIHNLQDASEKFTLNVLLGEPTVEKLRPAYLKAENILNKMPGKKVFVKEHEAHAFSKMVAAEIAGHDAQEL